MSGELVQVPEELAKIHKDIYLTSDMFFVNCISFFINLTRKILFKAVKHLPTKKVETIFKAFREIYSY